ncbi:MAG: hypothetical protein M3R10_03130 [Verrucomicrobiota bacterium]|nr:hypothetical protein [Verrucomicrobiota bacterium]
MIRPLSLLLAVTFALTGCSYMTATGRSQHAYARYVRKMSKGRVKQQTKFRSSKPQMPTTQTGEPTQNTESGPQAVPREDAQPQPTQPPEPQ